MSAAGSRCASRAFAAAFALAAAACHTAGALPEPQWQSIAVPTNASLRGLAVADGVVWVGGKGALLCSGDGGASWRDVRPRDARDCDFRDVEAFDAQTALAMVAGQPARLYRTVDGGASWTVVLEDPRAGAFFDAIAFAGDDGVLFGDPVDGVFSVWTSRDRGRTWTGVPPAHLPAPLPGEAGFAAGGACAIVVARQGPHARIATGGAAARCLTLPFDGAVPASAAPLPLLQGAPSMGAFALAERRGRVVAVGGDHADARRADGTAAVSFDGGASWAQVAGGAGGYRSAVAWLDDATVLAVGSHGASLSPDRGRSWRPFGARGFHALAVAADGTVWACGGDGQLARLTADR